MFPAPGATKMTSSGKDGRFPKLKGADDDMTVDMNILDHDVESFLARLKKASDGNPAFLLKDITQLTHQLKASRELLLMGSLLYSSRAKGNLVDRLIDATHTILNADKVYFFEIDSSGRSLVLTHSKEKSLIGSKIPVEVGIEGDVFSNNKNVNIDDASQDKRYFNGLESKSSPKPRAVLCVPVSHDGIVIGVLEVVNRAQVAKSATKSPRLGADSSAKFTDYEELLLSFVATNVAMSLRQGSRVSAGGTASQRITPIIMSGANLPPSRTLSRSGIVSPSSDPKLTNMLEKAYLKLDAERVSVFSYNATTKSLVCVVSQDIKGFTISADRGFAGLSFTTVRVVNVADAKEDSRHNKDADKHAGFTTRNLLCAPITDGDGSPIGVIQAINKKTGPNFTALDEETITELCRQMSHFLSDKKPSGAPFSVFSAEGMAVSMTRSISRLMCANALEDVAGMAGDMLKKLTAYDYAGFYIFHKEGLVRIVPSDLEVEAKVAIGPTTSCSERIMDTSDTVYFNNIPSQFKEALQFRTIVDCKPNPNGGSTNFFPGVSLYQSYAIPLDGSRAYGYTPGALIALVGSTSANSPPLGSFTLDAVQAYSEGIAVAIAHVSEIQHQEMSTKALKKNFHMINNTLGTLREFVILLNPDGCLAACNKMLEDLLGDEKVISDGLHYTQWLKESNSKELFHDIGEVLKTSETREKPNVKLVSKIHPHGIAMDFMVAPIACPADHQQDQEKQQRIEDGSPCAVVVVIRLMNSTADVAPHAFLDTDASFSAIHGHTAHGVAEAANVMLSNLQKSFDLDPSTSEQLKVVSGLLSDASRALSISNANYSAVQLALQTVNVQLVDPSLTLPDNIYDWEFNVLEINNRLLLCSIIGKFFERTFADFDEISVDPSTLARFILEVSKNYHDRPFHNFQHATCVTHFTYMLLTNCNAAESLLPHQMFAVLSSAIVHDVDHPGNTNTFEINSQSELALRYNDKSVLENHHCATAFRIMRKSQMQILGGMESSISVEVRKLIISCVMATDMAVHFELIDETKKRAQDGWNLSEPKEQSLLGMVLLHAADLSNPVRPFHMTREWAQRISIEFNDQVDKEQKLGMPVLGYMRTPDQKAFCKNETGFASFVVAPMWRAVASVFPQLHFLVDQLDTNLVTWKATLDEIVENEAKAAAKPVTADGGEGGKA